MGAPHRRLAIATGGIVPLTGGVILAA